MSVFTFIGVATSIGGFYLGLPDVLVGVVAVGTVVSLVIDLKE